MSVRNARRRTLVLMSLGLMWAVLFAGIVWASMRRNFLEGLDLIVSDPWGIVTLIDLYAGFGMLALWIALTDGSRVRATVAILLLIGLGNLAGLGYVIYRVVRCTGLREALLGDSAAR